MNRLMPLNALQSLPIRSMPTPTTSPVGISSALAMTSFNPSASSNSYSGSHNGSSFDGKTGVSTRRLLDSDFKDIHRVICAGFDVEIPIAEIDIRLRQGGYDPLISIGAFHEKAMVGFWLSSFRTIGDQDEAFCTGAAVLSEWRRMGIATRLFRHAEAIAREMKASAYRLLVDPGNKAAVALYEKAGFLKSREFVTYSADEISFDLEENDVMAFTVQLEKAVSAGNLMRHPLSWSGMSEGLFGVRDSLIAAVAVHEGQDAGYGIFQPITGRIVQFGIKMMNRRLEISTAQALLRLIFEFSEDKRKPELFQIPSESMRIPALLSDFGFRQSDRESEMMLDLKRE